MFDDFGVAANIRYNTFKNLCESILTGKADKRDGKEDIRDLIANVILGKEVIIAESNRATMRHRVLLADEVDVLFGSNFYGKSYNVLASLRGKEEKVIEDLIRHIWTLRDVTDNQQVWQRDVVRSPAYIACQARFPEWVSLIESAAKSLLRDVRDKDHKVDDVHREKGIGYYDNDNVMVYNRRDGYKTLFAFFKGNAEGVISDKMLLDEMNILVTAGSLSYAELPKLYSYTLGVSGTLSELSDEENRQLDAKYKMQKRTIMPSAYPACDNIPVFKGQYRVDIFAAKSESYFEAIAKEIGRNLTNNLGNKPRAVLVFFESDTVLEEFAASECFKKYAENALKLVQKTSEDERDDIVKQAVEEKRVTLLIAAFGRGTDFNYDNDLLDESGGVHVIQTFLSNESSEETQIRGRTKRQGHPGTYSMVLCESDLERGGITPSSLQRAKIGDDLYSAIKHRRSVEYAKTYAEMKELAARMRAEHEESETMLEHLWGRRFHKVREMIEARNLTRIQFVGVASRTIILMDGTGSMAKLFDKCKQVIKEMLMRIRTVLRDQLGDKADSAGFEVQFVVYRNYSSTVNCLLEASDWHSNPEELFGFLENTKTSGGEGNEAIELGLWHVNQERHKGDGVTQVILIGDMPANTKKEVASLRQNKQADGLVGEAYWSQKTPYKTPVNFGQELANVAPIPIHARYLLTYNSRGVKQAFTDIASATGGTVAELKLGDADGSEQLMSVFAGGILRDIQNNNGADASTDLYGAYVKKYKHSDVGFV